MISTSTSSTLLLPMLYCAIAVAVPRVVSPGVISPTGTLVALGSGVNGPVLPAGRVANVIVAVEMSPWQAPLVSLMVAVNVSVDVLLEGLVVQKNRDPVYRGWPFAPPTFGFA